MRNLLIPLAALLTATTASAQTPNPISPDRLSADVRVLSSDEFQGRAPGTPGEQVTIDWLIGQLQAIGLEPAGTDGVWTQAVPLVRTQLGAGAIIISGSAAPIVFSQSREIYVSTVRPVDRVAIANAPMVFVGHGVTAPERDWDDFKGVDLTGKIAVFIVNDPDFSASPGEDAVGQFGDRRMTYYGRWTYKFEEAARRGAIGALIIHDTPGAGYGWNTVIAPAGENYDIVRSDPNSRVALQGWLEGDAATRLFADAGLDLAALRIAARSRDFRPVDLGALRFSADIPVTHSRVESQNVLAKLPGTTRPVLSDQSQLVSVWRDAPQTGRHHAATDCHSANAAERDCLKV